MEGCIEKSQCGRGPLILATEESHFGEAPHRDFDWGGKLFFKNVIVRGKSYNPQRPNRRKPPWGGGGFGERATIKTKGRLRKGSPSMGKKKSAETERGMVWGASKSWEVTTAHTRKSLRIPFP